MYTTRPRTPPFGLAAIAAALVFAGGCAAGDDGDDAAAELPTLHADTDEDGAADDATDDTAEQTDERSGSGSDEEVDPEIALAEYERCMRDQGIDLKIVSGTEGAAVEELEVGDDGIGQDVATGDPGGTAFEAAAEACDPLLEDAFGDFELTPEQEADLADQMLEMQRCLADRGFDIDLSGNAFELDADIDFAEFDAAMSECQPDTPPSGAEVGP